MHLKKLVILFCLFQLYQTTLAQSPQIKSAEAFYNARQYKKAAQQYFDAFATDTTTQTSANLLNAAKAAAQGSYPDSAFKYLCTITDRRDQQFYTSIIYEPAFIKLREDKRWDALRAVIDRQRRAYKSAVARDLIQMQQERVAAERKKYLVAYQLGRNSKIYQLLRDSVRELDTTNYLKLRSIINTYGWLDANAVSGAGVRAFLYLYAKLGLPIQKRYFPIIATAFKTGGIDAQNFAVIADRIALFDTGHQIYGTQSIPNTILNKDSVNMRRMEIGLMGL
ncbi:MAG: DUF6624 domain-containing protein [Sphingobacteriales bacterium]